MLPLIIVAFAGIGVTRLALLALELHDDEAAARQRQQEQEAGQGAEEEDPDRAKARVLWEMARRKKPAKLIARNDCQYVCVWEERDLANPNVSVDDLLRACARRQYQHAQQLQQQQEQGQQEEDGDGMGGSGQMSFYQRVLAEMTAFFDQLAVGRALQEPALKPPGTATAAGGGSISRTGSSASLCGLLGRARLPSSPSLSDLLQEPAVALLRGAMQRRRGRGRQQQGQQGQESGGTAAASCSWDQNLGQAPTIDAEEMEGEEEAGATAAAEAAEEGHYSGDGCCVVCYEAPRDAVFLTCGHGSTCLGCAVDVYRASGECPLCRARIDQIVTVGPRREVVGGGEGLVVADVLGPALCV